MTTYDYIIVGGGSSGCVLANRLSENPAHKVLLIESGRRDADPWIHIPATFFKVLGKGIDIHPYASNPDKGLNGRPSIVPQGNVLGGGSSVNAMIYMRGKPEEYDEWDAASGGAGWTWRHMLPHYTRLEGNQRHEASREEADDGENHRTEPSLPKEQGVGGALLALEVQLALFHGVHEGRLRGIHSHQSSKSNSR